MNVKLAATKEDLIRAFPAMKELRPQLTEETYMVMVERMMKSGYHLAMLELANGEVVCVGGFLYR